MHAHSQSSTFMGILGSRKTARTNNVSVLYNCRCSLLSIFASHNQSTIGRVKMACTTAYIEFVCSQLEGAGIVRAKKMFGDWMVYIDEKPVILACDNLCYVKMWPEIADLMNDAWTDYPYPGAKEHYVLDIEHRNLALKVVNALLPIVPFPKKKK